MLKRSTWVGGALMLALLCGDGSRALAQNVAAPAVAPSAPSGLTYLVNGGNVSLFWTHATGPFTHYIIEAGATPGTTFFSFSTSSVANASLLTQLIAAFGTSGVGAGNYYVRVRAANGAEIGPATPDILVPVRAGCQTPGAPSELNMILRAANGWLQWNPGSGGTPSAFLLLASYTPGGTPIAAFSTTTNYLNVAAIPPATYYVRVLSQNACGQSAPSNEIVVTVPSPINGPARTPDPVNGGRLGMPFVYDVVQQVVAQNPGLLAASCPDANAKYTLNPFVNAVVDRLRQLDTRFGYNSKPTRGPADNGGQRVVVAGDEIAYHYGSDAPEGSPNVHLVDVLFGHCGPNPSLTWRFFTNGEFGRWTGAGRF